MAKRTRWKIVVAALAVVIAGIVYCAFFTEEKDGTVQYQTGEEAADDYGISVNASVGNAGSDDTQDFVTGQDGGASQNMESGQSSVTGQKLGLADGDVQNDCQKLIYVHVCGAVVNPGVYAVSEGARVCDAIAMAGGLAEDAADDYVNQARFLIDGERVYIPEKNELGNLTATQYAAGQPANTGSGQSVGVQGSQEQNPLNINTATLNELTTLPGIGESRAESIIAYREEYGAFAKIEDIMKISGIKGAAYEKIKDRICTGNE